MRWIRSIIILAVSVLLSTDSAFAQAGVCDRATAEAKQAMDSDVKSWTTAINNTNLPQEVKNAYLVLFNYNRSESFKAADKEHDECTRSFKPYQDLVDAIEAIYTLGLSKVLQPSMMHVDVSELLKGYTLGGPNALVPKFREDILRGDHGTFANILRDPYKCLTFQTKC